MAIRTQSKLMIRRVQFIRRKKDAATLAACAGDSRKHYSEYGKLGKVVVHIKWGSIM